MYPKTQHVRTGYPHQYPLDVATQEENQFSFVVDPLPYVDHAAAALSRAQAEYAEKHELTVEQMSDMFWTIRKI